MSSPLSEVDGREYEQIARETQPDILVIGCGGAGCNTINHMAEEEELESVERIAVNTDAQDLIHTKANQKILIGRETTGGIGTGSDSEKGKAAAREDKEKIEEIIEGHDIVFLTCGLGGGTGTGAGPIIADISKSVDALTVGVVTLPFESEGEKRVKNASDGLAEFEQNSDTTIFVPDDKLLEIAPDLSLEEAFKLADSVLVDTISGIIKLVSETGLINLDFEDVRATFENGGIGMVGFGEGSGKDRSLEAVTEALENPLLEMEIENAERALISITGSPNLRLDEAETIAGNISERLSPNAQVAWGARISNDLEEAVMINLIVSETKDLVESNENVDLGLESL